MKKQYTIKVTVFLEDSFWVGIFERNDDEGYAVSRQIFDGEPTDAELYNFVLKNYSQLKFTHPHDFKLIIKRKKFKRMQRDVRKEMHKIKKDLPKSSHAQEALRIDLEKKKKTKQVISKAKKEEMLERKFNLKQEKRKKKHRGH